MPRGASTSQESGARSPWIYRGLLDEVAALLQILRVSQTRKKLVWLGASMAAVVSATAYGQIELNAWNKPFYDAITHRDLNEFLRQLGVFAVIAAALLALNVAQMWLNQMFRVELRAGLTRDLFAQWLAPKRAFMIGESGEIGVHPDQRIHEDARHLSDLTTDLALGLLQASLLLVCFLGVLWQLSADVTFKLGEEQFIVPGYMVWSALFYAGTASIAGWLVGRPLINLNTTHYARESDIRYQLVSVDEHRESISLFKGEAHEEAKLNKTYDNLQAVLHQLVTATTNLTWVTAGYGWFTIVAPIIVASPAFFAGDLSVGGLFMSAGAFTQVQQSLRWFVDNASVIADWRATLHRVGAFRLALIDIDQKNSDQHGIRFQTSNNNKLTFNDLSICLPTGRIRLSQPRLDMTPGEHLLIIGAPGTGKTSLFRALAGLWLSSSGEVDIPAGAKVMFMPKRPFIPEGSVKEMLSYPLSIHTFQDDEYLASLDRLGLAYLADGLTRVARWDEELNSGEKLGVAFSRLLLHKPDCVIVDEAIEDLTPQMREDVFDMFKNELAATFLVAISGPRAAKERYDHILELVFEPNKDDPKNEF